MHTTNFFKILHLNYTNNLNIFVVDKEELRADKAVKITRKELNNLIAELFEFTDMFSKQEQEISKKRRSPENTNFSSENNMVR